MPDVRGFVRINAGVFDQNLAGWNVGLRFFIGSERGGENLALQSGIDVACPSKLQLLKPLDQSNGRNDLFGNLPRRLAQLLGQLKGKWQRIFAKFHSRRLLDDDLRQVETVAALQKLAYLLGKPAFQMTIQGSL